MHERAVDRLILSLLELDTVGFEPSLRQVLHMFAEVTRSDLLFLEVRERPDVAAYRHGCSAYPLPPGGLRARVPQDMLESAITGARLVESMLSGVQGSWRGPSHAVCAPLGRELPIGALYVERDAPFPSYEKEQFAALGHHLAKIWPHRTSPTLAEDLHARKVSRIRQALERHGGVVAEAARALGASRMLIYRLCPPRVTRRDTAVEDLSPNETDETYMEYDETEIDSNPPSEH